MDEAMTTIRILVRLLDDAINNQPVADFIFEQLDDALDVAFNEGWTRFEVARALGPYRDILDDFFSQ